MADDEKFLGASTENAAPEKKAQPSKWNNFWRKQMVSLKRKPQRIGFWLYIITCVYYLFCLGTFSGGLMDATGLQTDWVGLLVFVNLLFAILAIVLYLYSFPKLQKFGSKTVKQVEFAKGIRVNFNIVMLVLLVIFSAVIIMCDGLYYSIMNPEYLENLETNTAEAIKNWERVKTTLNMTIADIVLTGAALICGCLTYVFGRLFVKVDTSIAVESSAENMGHIDLVEDE